MFGSLLIQSGAPVYVKEQMGHGSIQATVDTYGHLIPAPTFPGWIEWKQVPKQTQTRRKWKEIHQKSLPLKNHKRLCQ
jgi:hypothetical protein